MAHRPKFPEMVERYGESDRERSLPLFRFLGLLLVGAAVLVWLLLPFLPRVFSDRPAAEALPSSCLYGLAAATAYIDRDVIPTLLDADFDLQVLRMHEQEEVIGPIHWRSLMVEFQLPTGVEPESLVEQLYRVDFDPTWNVSIELYYLEPLSPAVQILVNGYPTHLFQFHPGFLLKRRTTDPSSPKIALVFEDIGLQPDRLGALWRLILPFAVAIVPYAPYAPEAMEMARQYNKEVLAHIPMERWRNPTEAPISTSEPMMGELLRRMTVDEVRATTARALEAIPNASGVSNRFGSAFVLDRARMAMFFDVIQGDGKFFLDMRRSPRSIAPDLARSAGLRLIERSVIIDADGRPALIERALNRLEATALQNGSAVGVCHAEATTLRELVRWIQDAQDAGFEFVRLSSLM